MKPALLILAALALQANAQVQRDPFARPAGALLAAASNAAANAAGTDPAPPDAAPPRLRAIMFEPGKSLVNIDGRILALGERYQDYLVSAITARSATLTRRGVRSVIVLDQESSK